MSLGEIKDVTQTTGTQPFKGMTEKQLLPHSFLSISSRHKHVILRIIVQLI